MFDKIAVEKAAENVLKAMFGNSSPDREPGDPRQLFYQEATEWKALFGALRAQSLLNCFNERPGTAAPDNTIYLLCSWLVDRASRYGVEDALCNLENYLKVDAIPYLHIMLIQGLEVSERCDLSPRLSLMPVCEVPSVSFQHGYEERIKRSEAAQMLAVQRRGNTGYAGIWSDHLTIEIHPHSALVLKGAQPKAHLEKETADKSQEVAALEDESLEDGLSFLTLIGNSGPVDVAQWSEVEDWVPLKGYGGGIMRCPYIEQLTRQVTVASREQLAEAQRHYGQYRKLSPKDRQSLAVPLHRLKLASRRLRPVDRAIDLGIALEAVLLNERSDRGDGLSFPLRLRGAYLLGGNDFGKRQALERFLNDLYGLRSRAVHVGAVPPTISIGGVKRPIQEVLNDGIQLCSEIVLKILELGRFPDWSRLILGGGAA